jgi:hypothetical protein
MLGEFVTFKRGRGALSGGTTFEKAAVRVGIGAESSWSAYVEPIWQLSYTDDRSIAIRNRRDHRCEKAHIVGPTSQRNGETACERYLQYPFLWKPGMLPPRLALWAP